MFIDNIEFAWGWYADHMKQFISKEPHEGYHLIKKYIDKRKLDYFILTSNVDCMWKKTGFDVNKIMEYHGSMDYLQSFTKKGQIWPTDYAEIENVKYDPDTFICKKNTIPRCPYDGKYARPNVCFFEDADYFNTSRFEKIDKNFQKWYMNIATKNKRLVVVEIGAGTIIPTVRNMSEEMVKEHLIRLQEPDSKFSRLIRINPKEDAVPSGQISIKMNGLQAIRKLFT
jgi:NAD-dependent SIR2 family protein deacetylase